MPVKAQRKFSWEEGNLRAWIVEVSPGRWQGYSQSPVHRPGQGVTIYGADAAKRWLDEVQGKLVRIGG